MKREGISCILATNNKELMDIKEYLIKEYPDDKKWINKLIEVNMPFPLCVYVYDNPEDGFGNRIEWDALDNIDFEYYPLEVYKNPKDYPEYFL